MSIGGSQRGSAATAWPKRKNWRCSRCARSIISQASAHIHEGGLRMAMNASQGGHERQGGDVWRTINGKLVPMSTRSFDARFYQRFYMNPRTRVTTREEMARRAGMVAALVQQLELPV